jgi:CheY-like chemotaxis protein
MTTATGTLPATVTEGEVTVLIVDDAAIDRRLAGAIIGQNLGWRVAYAEDGAAALSAMERETPRVVLTDLRMPGMDGLELVTRGVGVVGRDPVQLVVVLQEVDAQAGAAVERRPGNERPVPCRRLHAVVRCLHAPMSRELSE